MDPEFPEQQTRDHVEQTIAEALQSWKDCDFEDLDLWEAFQEHFAGYTESDFKLVKNDTIRRLRTHLRIQCVWVERRARTSIAKSLFNTLQEQNPTPWTEFEIMECKDNEGISSCHIENLLKTDFGRKPTVYSTPHAPPVPPVRLQTSILGHRMQALPVPPQVAVAPMPQQAPPVPRQISILGRGMQALPVPPQASSVPPQAPLLPPQAPPVLLQTLPVPPKVSPTMPLQSFVLPVILPVPQQAPPISPQALTSGHGKELSNLAKMYTDEAKYSGENNSFKLTIFHDICARADVPYEAKMKAFSTMLERHGIG